ncbi:probable Very long-chain fatty acid transport protein [Saccharomycodes ludwigii]|uniref:Very long-chain fatty acid transport protein n=1 Tax=Saccharomycodes ludwigii TaxID=36035 RepID=A0A376B8P4_9ASCO|nr:probable Very long-chain fatty acid transport protein [Saccharomycodes ludwigii]
MFKIILKLIKTLLFPILTLLHWITKNYSHIFANLYDYFDSKTRLREDFHIAPYFFIALFSYIKSLIITKKFQYWYIFESKVSKHPKKLCLVYPNLQANGDFNIEQYTYKEVYDIVLRLSYYLHNDLNIKEAEIVGMYYTNKPTFIFFWLALWNLGAIPAFMNYNSAGAPLIHSLKIANIKHVLIDPETIDVFTLNKPDIMQNFPYIKLHEINEDSLYSNVLFNAEKYPKFRQSDKIRSPKTLTDYSPACLIYTSGTTGLPKSAIMSWRKACLGCSLFGRIYHMNGKNSVVFTAMPLYHSTAALLGVCAVFSQGGCVALSHKFSASTFWKQVYLTKATHVQYVGEICRYLLNTKPSQYEQLHNVKIAYGNGLRPDIWTDFKKRFNIPVIGEFYASTEAPFATTSYQTGDFGVGACRNYGPLVTWFLSYEQRLVKMDPNDSAKVYRDPQDGLCRDPEIGEPGEVLMRIFFPKKPETSFQGYLGNKSATDSKVLRDVFRNGDAWYRSGDLLKSDKYGLWYFVDRMGDTFRWKSENVSTKEVEDQFMHTALGEKCIDEIVVVGLKVLNFEGKCGFACISLKKDGSNFQSVEQRVEFLNKILETLNKNLPKYALPVFVKFVDEIEHTDNHKIKKTSYSNQMLPHGSGNNETLYFLRNYKKYQELTDKDWDDIKNNIIKL